MFISDLSYLETTVSADVVGGGRRRRGRGGVEVNIANVKQVAVSKASAFAIKGNAVAVSKASNSSFIYQG